MRCGARVRRENATVCVIHATPGGVKVYGPAVGEAVELMCPDIANTQFKSSEIASTPGRAAPVRLGPRGLPGLETVVEEEDGNPERQGRQCGQLGAHDGTAAKDGGRSSPGHLRRKVDMHFEEGPRRKPLFGPEEHPGTADIDRDAAVPERGTALAIPEWSPNGETQGTRIR